MYPSIVNSNAQRYGFKVANLMYLRDEVLQNKQTVVIPDFVGISKDDVITYLDQHAPGWMALWHQFTEQQSSPDVIDAIAAKTLEALQRDIRRVFREHQFSVGGLPKAQRLMVRSTGNEDRVDIANPGGNESVVSERDSENISCAIGEVIASYFSVKSMSQRLKSGDDITQNIPTLACMLQDLVSEELEARSPPVSGVMYTDYRGNVYIQAAPGHGELVVNSRGHCDDIYITRENSIFKTVRRKPYRLEPGLKYKNNSAALEWRASLSDSMALKLADVARKIDQKYAMSMDIEFVYDAHAKKINIVQVRACVEGVLNQLPKAITLHYLANHPNIARYKGEMVTLGVMSSVLVKQPEEILVCDAITQALRLWNQHKDVIKAVVIRDYAASTSHEAALFNSKKIPVLRLQQLDGVRTWVRELGLDMTLVLDPQNRSIFRIPSVDLEQTGEACPIQDGIYHSLMTEHVTPSTRTFFSRTAQFTSFTAGERKKYHSLQQIEEDLHQLSLLSPGRQSELREILQNLVLFACHVLKKDSSPLSSQLFSAIVMAASELLKWIDHPQNNFKANLDYLNILKKFEGLLISQHQEDILSTSLVRSLAAAKQPHQHSKFPYYQELVTLGRYIAVQERRPEWEVFCKQVCENGQGAKLATLVADLVKTKTHEYWINIQFFSEKKDLNVLYDAYYNRFVTQERDELFHALKELNELTRQIDLWSEPEAYDGLFPFFSEKIQNILKTLVKDTHRNNLMMRFNVLDQWIDLFDRSIKALQHGQYQDVQKELQVQRFRQMLLLFLEQIKEIPRYGSYKDIILEHFLKINNLKNKNQLDISPNFNVTQANPFAYHNRINETNVYRAYLNVPSYTLADIHSVIHQAWMSYNARAFVKQVGFSIDFIPLPMKLLLERFKELSGLGYYFRFPSLLEFNAPMTRIKYNIPMNNHAVQVCLAYNFHQNIFHLKIEGYGGLASGMWNQSSIGVFRDASETNAIINRFDFYNYGFIFDADVTNPDDCLTLMRSFNNYLPYFHEEFEKIPCVIAEMSDAVCELFQKSKSFDHQVKNFYLNRTDKEKYQQLLNSPSYNGMLLVKHGLLNAEGLKDLSSEQLDAICSDELIAAYSSSQLNVPPA